MYIRIYTALILFFCQSQSAYAANAYITDASVDNVLAVDVETDSVVATISVGDVPVAVAVSPDGSKAYVANRSSNTLSAINTATNTVSSTLGVGTGPMNVAYAPMARCFM